MKDDELDQAALAQALKFDPKRFQSDYRVTRWEPGREVQFDKPLGIAAVATALFCLLFGAVWVWAGSVVLKDGLHPTSKVPHPIVALLVFALLGLIPAGFGLVLVGEALPRRVRIDWPTATITVGRLWKEETPFSQIAGLEVHRMHRTSRSKRGGAYARHFFWCELKAKIRADAGESTRPLLLVSTDSRDDPEGPFRHLLPLATELSAALGVNRDVVSRNR